MCPGHCEHRTLRLQEALGVLSTLLHHPASGRVGGVTDCGVRGLGFKSPGLILTSRTETRSLSRVVKNGWDPCSVPLRG